MIPVLFERAQYAITGTEIGPLDECVSCNVTEELDPAGSYECTLEIPYNARYFEKIIARDEHPVIYTTAAYGKEPQVFDVYRVTMADNGIATVNAKHISRRLRNVILWPFNRPKYSDYLQKKVSDILGNTYIIYSSHLFSFTCDRQNYGELDLVSDVPIDAMSFLTGETMRNMFSSDEYFCEYEWDNGTIKHMWRRGSTTPIKARYGVNVETFSRYFDNNDTYNAVVPYWSRDGETVIGDVIKTSNMRDVNRAVDLTSEFSEKPSQSDLINRAYEIYFPFNSASVPVVYDDLALEGVDENFSIDLLQTPDNTDLQTFGYAQLGDSVDLDYTQFNWTYTGARVIKLTYDSLMERNTKLTISQNTKPERTYGDIIRASL